MPPASAPLAPPSATDPTPRVDASGDAGTDRAWPADAFARVAAPTLVISGADDPATPPEHGRLLADGIPGARFEVVGPEQVPALLPELRRVSDAWLASTDEAEQKKIATEMQLQAFEDVPYIPLGQVFSPTAQRKEIVDIPDGFALFWGVRRA